MNFTKPVSYAFLLICLTFAISACSKSSDNPAQPVIEPVDQSFGSETDDRNLIAVYDAVIDPDAGTFEITPVERTGSYHFPLTQLYPNALQITGYGWTPIFWVDIVIQHPLPGSGIDVYDPRVIAILPANPGVSMDYPVLDVLANNSVILEPDGYTKQYDSLNPGIPGNTNPFIAYFKTLPNRVWSSTGFISELKRWQMDLSGFGGPIQFMLVVDILTNYPNPPQPDVDNAPEPVEIEAVIEGGLNEIALSAPIDVTLLDWQGSSDIRCEIESPYLFNGTTELSYNEPGPNPDEYLFSGTINNDLYAPEGECLVLISAQDVPSGIQIFKEVTVMIREDRVFNPVNISPSWLIDLERTYDVCIQDNYAYVAAVESGLHVFNVSDPLNPFWYYKVDTPGQAVSVSVTGGYAYVANYESGLQIIDIDPVEDARIVKSVNTDYAQDVYVSDGYAYVADYDEGLRIIDIDPVEDARIVKKVNTPGEARSVHVIGDYAYVADGNARALQIIDINPVGDAHIEKSVSDLFAGSMGVYVMDGYAYVTANGWGLHIIDIDPIENASVVKTVDLHQFGLSQLGVYVTEGYSYIAAWGQGLYIVDVDPVGGAHLVKSVDTPGSVYSVFVSDGYAYVPDYWDGVRIIDVEPWEDASIVSEIPITFNIFNHANGVCVTHGYAYVADSQGGLKIVDTSTPENVRIEKVVDTNDARDVCVSHGYAYVADFSDGLQIIDLASASIVKSVDTPGGALEVNINNGYAYVTDSNDGLQIIDIDPVENASIVKSVNWPGSNAVGIGVENGYAYVTDYDEGFKIIDIDPIENASVVKTIFLSGNASRIYVTDGYAYVTDYQNGLHIIDVDPPENAGIVNQVTTPGDPSKGVYVKCGYAFVADGTSGLQIIDVNPPESASIVSSIDTLDLAEDVVVTDGYAYVSSSGGGLRIIKLW